MDIYQILDSLNIKYQKYEHEAVFTNEESQKLEIGTAAENTKNLFLKNEKSTRYFLLTIQHGKRADLKKFAGQIGEKKFTFANADDLKRLLNLTPGSVTPTGLRFNTNQRVEYYLDKDLLEQKIIYFHPDINTATIGLKPEDFKKFIEFTKHQLNFY